MQYRWRCGSKVESQEKGFKVYVKHESFQHCGMFRVGPCPSAVMLGFSLMRCLPSLITVFIRLYHHAGLTLHSHHIIILSGHNMEKWLSFLSNKLGVCHLFFFSTPVCVQTDVACLECESHSSLLMKRLCSDFN